jgi:hypothetical protein
VGARDGEPVVTEVVLEAMKVAVAKRFSRSRVECYAELEFDTDCMVARLEQYVLSERLADECVVWPATWWDAFKERWFPWWWLRRWPAKHAHADFTVYRGYPDISLPEQRNTLFIQRQWPDDR